jgi:hypothetical protein
MRDMLKNPMLYYILAPILVGLWPLLVWGVYLPRMQQGLETDVTEYDKATARIDEIWAVDPDRKNASDKNSGLGFSYGEAISRVADRCHITSRNYTINAGAKVKISNKEIQEAKVTLTDADIVQACNFLYTVQSMWVNLECQSVTLKKKEGAPDRWDVDLSFKYTY